MPKNDKAYHERRASDHRAMAEAATAESAKLAHLALAEQHAEKLKAMDQCKDPADI